MKPIKDSSKHLLFSFFAVSAKIRACADGGANHLYWLTEGRRERWEPILAPITIDSEGRDGSGDVKVLVSLHMFILRTAGLVGGLRSILLARVLSEDLTPNPSPFVSGWQARFISRPPNWVLLSSPERFSIVFFWAHFSSYHLKIKLNSRLSKHRNHNWVTGLNT